MKATRATAKRLREVLEREPKPARWRRSIRVDLPEELAKWIDEGLAWGMRRFLKHRDSCTITLLNEHGEFSEDALALIESQAHHIGVVLDEHGWE